MIIVGSGKSTTTYSEEILMVQNNANVGLSMAGDYNYDFPLYLSYEFSPSSGDFVAYSQIYSLDDIYQGAILYRTSGANGNGAGSQLYKYEIVTPPNQSSYDLSTVVNLTTYYAKENTTYEGVELTDIIIVDTQTGQQTNIEKIQDNLGNILFYKDYFNYTAIDANGNYEGTAAYDGTAVAYAIGQLPSNGTDSVNSYTANNGLKDEFKGSGSGLIPDETLKKVPDTLIIPDEHNGLPVTTIMSKAFMARENDLLGNDKWYQPSFYKNIVFGKNINTLSYYCFGGMRINIVLPETIRYCYPSIMGNKMSINEGGSIEVNSNIVPPASTYGMYSNVPKVIFNRNVTEVKNILATNNDSGAIWVFKHEESDPLTITFNNKPKSATSVTIYADNNVVKNYDWSTNANVTATIYPLSDYVG